MFEGLKHWLSQLVTLCVVAAAAGVQQGMPPSTAPPVYSRAYNHSAVLSARGGVTLPPRPPVDPPPVPPVDPVKPAPVPPPAPEPVEPSFVKPPYNWCRYYNIDMVACPCRLAPTQDIACRPPIDL